MRQLSEGADDKFDWAGMTPAERKEVVAGLRNHPEVKLSVSGPSIQIKGRYGHDGFLKFGKSEITTYYIFDNEQAEEVGTSPLTLKGVQKALDAWMDHKS